ncbi:hypothetical protein LguiA_004987 [Lonicera macranthoides]
MLNCKVVTLEILFNTSVFTSLSLPVSRAALRRGHAILTLVSDDDKATTPVTPLQLLLRFHLPRHYSSSTTDQSLLPKEICKIEKTKYMGMSPVVDNDEKLRRQNTWICHPLWTSEMLESGQGQSVTFTHAHGMPTKVEI